MVAAAVNPTLSPATSPPAATTPPPTLTPDPSQNPFAQVSPRDAHLLRRYFELHHNPFALADDAAEPPDQILRWFGQPHIQAAIALLDAARRDGNRAAADLALRAIAETSEDPIERRRAATALLRSSLPSEPRRQAAKPTTTSSAPPNPHCAPPHPKPPPVPRRPAPDLSVLPSPGTDPDPEHALKTVLAALSTNMTPFEDAGVAKLKKFWDTEHELAALSKFNFESWVFRNFACDLFGTFRKIGAPRRTAGPDGQRASFPVTVGPFEAAPYRAHFTFHLIRRTAQSPWLITGIEPQTAPPPSPGNGGGSGATRPSSAPLHPAPRPP